MRCFNFLEEKGKKKKNMPLMLFYGDLMSRVCMTSKFLLWKQGSAFAATLCVPLSLHKR